MSVNSFLPFSYYLQGRHLGLPNIPCQDFALPGVDQNHENSFVCLADGCSSSPGSDLGARLLCYLVAKKLKANEAIYECELIQEAEEIAKILGVKFSRKLSGSLFGPQPQRVLDATLVYSLETKDTIDTFFYGDGSLYLKYNDGSYKFYTIEYTSNAPYYLSYLIYGAEVYKAYCGDGKKILTSLHFKFLDEEKFFLSDDHAYDYLEILDSSSIDLPLYEKFSLSENKNNLLSMMITSDGIGSFQSNSSKPIIHERVFSQILPKIKNQITAIAGDPLERRMNKFKKDYEKLGWFPNDDLSIGLLIRDKVGY